MPTTFRRLCVFSLALVILLSACSSDGAPQSAPVIPGLAQTLAAQTLTAREVHSSRLATPEPVPVEPNIKTSINYLPTATPEIQESPTPEMTAWKQTQMARTRLEEACTNQAEFVQDVTVPDDTKMKSGQRFVKTWQFKNAGTCTWTKDYALVFMWGNSMDGQDPMPIDVEVAPEQTVNISIELTAPKQASIYQGNWMFETPTGERFGTGYKGRQFFWVSIVVGNGGILGGCVGGG
jgi:hypothetical protein